LEESATGVQGALFDSGWPAAVLNPIVKGRPDPGRGQSRGTPKSSSCEPCAGGQGLPRRPPSPFLAPRDLADPEVCPRVLGPPFRPLPRRHPLLCILNVSPEESPLASPRPHSCLWVFRVQRQEKGHRCPGVPVPKSTWAISTTVFDPQVRMAAVGRPVRPCI